MEEDFTALLLECSAKDNLEAEARAGRQQQNWEKRLTGRVIEN
jgi:hypothetical protein